MHGSAQTHFIPPSPPGPLQPERSRRGPLQDAQGYKANRKSWKWPLQPRSWQASATQGCHHFRTEVLDRMKNILQIYTDCDILVHTASAGCCQNRMPVLVVSGSLPATCELHPCLWSRHGDRLPECNTAKRDIDPIPSKHRARITDTESDTFYS